MLSRYNALMLTRLLSVFLVLATSLALVPARAQAPNLAGLAVSETPPPLPFTRGETLVYEVTFSRLVFSGMIGSLTLTVAPSRANMPDSVEFKAEGVSKGFFTWLFKIKVNDKYISSVNRDDFGLESSTRNIRKISTGPSKRMTAGWLASLPSIENRCWVNQPGNPLCLLLETQIVWPR